MTASITKPEVNMMFVDEVKQNEDNTWDLVNPYGIVPVGYNTITVFYDIGPMSKQLYEYRVAIADPEGDIVSLESDSFEIDSYGMKGYLVFDGVNFGKAGSYMFQFQMKLNNEYQTIARRTLIVE
jgi:hypothetical protein